MVYSLGSYGQRCVYMLIIDDVAVHKDCTKEATTLMLMMQMSLIFTVMVH